MIIRVGDTVLGSPPQVNANSALIVWGAAAGDVGATMPFAANGAPFLVRSPKDLDALGITEATNPVLFRQVNAFYAPKGGVNNVGTVLWIAGFEASTPIAAPAIVNCITKTIVPGFEYRPRNLMIVPPATPVDGPLYEMIQAAVDQLYGEGISTVALVAKQPASGTIADWPTLVTVKAPMVGVVAFSKTVGGEAAIGNVGGWMASLSVGTSIGDSSLPQFGTSFFLTDTAGTPCDSITETIASQLGEKGYIFLRTRAPKNGLWINDGATCNDPANALSTLEAGRVIASMVDDLRTFFTPYIGSKVPVAKNGDIEPTYKQIVLDNARSFVVIPYIENGDISDARLSLVAMNNDMIGTRTWEVTLEILDAPALRWIDGFVFYVKSL